MFRPTAIALAIASATLASSSFAASTSHPAADSIRTATPIKHVVVIYNENVSFDHYFGTYPDATNPAGEPPFKAAANTPAVNNLQTAHLLQNNPNLTNKDNGADAADPFRLDRTQANTADQNHAYTAEQQAYDAGKADLFPKFTGRGSNGSVGAFGTRGQVMGYFDGNTVTSLWNYAQRFAMSDNAYTDTFGPSTPGALEAVSGQTDGMEIVQSSKHSYYVDDGQGGYTMINDVDPATDVCSKATDQVWMTGKNIGDLLNTRNISWGSFMGGFDLDQVNANGSKGCQRSTYSTVVNSTVTDYIPHHAWFQYYQSTSNPSHAHPSSVAAIGYSTKADGKSREPANHEYDVNDFYQAIRAGNYPAVSFLKAPAFEDGHAGYSDPLDEQQFTTQVINFLQQQADWKNTAVIVAWDDSDGWYDHAYADTSHASYDKEADQLNGAGVCGSGDAPAGLKGKPVNGRCGPGTRIPFLVISPYAKHNFVSHTAISQASIVRFIEDNWLKSERIGGGSFDASAGSIMDLFDFKNADGTPLFLDPYYGTPANAPVAMNKAVSTTPTL